MITVIGAGAIGATIGASLARASHRVDFVDSDAAHVAAIEEYGLTVRQGEESSRVSARAFLPANYPESIHTAVLAVKAQHTLQAINGVRDRLAANAVVLVAQNGLGAFAVGETIGQERTLGALVNIAADCTAPGEVTFYGFGSLVIGRVGNADVPQMAEVVSLMGDVGTVETTDNLRGLLWNKLAFGAVLSATALDHTPQLDTILAHPRLVSHLLAEVLSVAQAERIEVPEHDHLDPAMFLPGIPEERMTAAIADWVEYQRPHQKPHSGIYRDLAVRRRKTEVSAHFADILRLGALHRIKQPVLTRLGELIAEAEEGSRALGPDNIMELEGLAR